MKFGLGAPGFKLPLLNNEGSPAILPGKGSTNADGKKTLEFWVFFVFSLGGFFSLLGLIGGGEYLQPNLPFMSPGWF